MLSGISAETLFELNKAEGYMWQPKLPLDTPPMFTLPEEYFSSIGIGYEWVSPDSSDVTGDKIFIDHPGFTRLRYWLSNNGYIAREDGWWNGDSVLKPFVLNDVWFAENEVFPCAAAMKGHLKLNCDDTDLPPEEFYGLLELSESGNS